MMTWKLRLTPCWLRYLRLADSGAYFWNRWLFLSSFSSFVLALPWKKLLFMFIWDICGQPPTIELFIAVLKSRGEPRFAAWFSFSLSAIGFGLLFIERVDSKPSSCWFSFLRFI